MPGDDDDDPMDLLRTRLATAATAPLITFYETRTGERTELSVATFTTWVAKISHLLRDDLGLAPGDRVGLLTRPHWLSLGVCAGVWAAGCTPVLDLVPGQPAELAAVAVTSLDPDVLTHPPVSTAEEVLAVSTRPMAAPYDEELPPGVADLVAQARGHPDALVVTPPADASGGAAWVGAARRRVRAAGVPAGARVLVPMSGAGQQAPGQQAPGQQAPGQQAPGQPLGPDVSGLAEVGGRDRAAWVRDALVVPLLVGGSAVLVSGADAVQLTEIKHTERVTLVLDPT